MNQEQALKYMHDLLKLMASKKASDLFIADDFPPSMKIDGKITPIANQKLAGRPISRVHLASRSTAT